MADLDDDSSTPSNSNTQSIEALTTGPLSSSVSNLSLSSRAIPSDQDFHFFLNFDQFRDPLLRIADNSQSMLHSLSSSLSGDPSASFPQDTDEAYERLVDVNDAIFEKFDASVDDLRADGDDFQLVTGKKKKKKAVDAAPEVKVATFDKKATGPKPKVPFHIPTIRRPQDQFNIFVNNSNQPFEHVWLQRTEDGQRFVHPLESVCVSDFVDDVIVDKESLKPSSLESTDFKLIEEVKDLKELAAKLRNVNEFAVDLEHNQYRSFQGLTCLIQISTRTEDFVIDALKLRVHIGPYLREVFKDPKKRKVMHGADRDIVWLQRDFGIYICNLFDTGQASRVLKLERHSLEYLLQHFCGVTANKEYQNADWRLRPLPKEMIRYAREDTHYLLYIYDLMRIELLSLSKELESPTHALLEVYKRSYDICMQLYEKELLTEDSYLYVYGLQGTDLNAQQLAIVAGLYEWRDIVARSEDESTGFILPNKALLEIAKTMPSTTGKLRRLVKSKHPYIEHNLGSVLSVIENSIQNAAAFESVVAHLKDGRFGKASEEKLGVNEEPEESKSISMESKSAPGESCNEKKIDSCNRSIVEENLGASEQRKDRSTSTSSDAGQVNGATVQVQKKPNRAFGALLGNKVTKKRFDLGAKDEQEAKLKQIRASVHFPFHSFSNNAMETNPVAELPVKASEAHIFNENAATSAANSEPTQMIMSQDMDESRNDDLATNTDSDVTALDIDKDEPMSLSDLSKSFQQCLETNKKVQVNKAKGLAGFQLKPFDYEAARREIVFGERSARDVTGDDKDKKGLRGSNKTKKKSNEGGRGATKDDETAEFAQGRRRKAFPASGNRSATFR